MAFGARRRRCRAASAAMPMPRPRCSVSTASGPSSNAGAAPTKTGQKRTEPRKRTVFDSDEAQARLGLDAFAQAIGGFGIAPGPEAALRPARRSAGRILGRSARISHMRVSASFYAWLAPLGSAPKPH